MSRHYEFLLPLETNDGASYARALGEFTREAVKYVGGVTIGPDVTGVWADDTGFLYLDKMRGYRVACEPLVAITLKARAVALFPDQKAFFVADLGTAEIFKPEEYA